MSNVSYQFDGVAGQIHVTTWSGAVDPRFVALLAHGYGEHAGRYDHVAAMLVGLGAAVYAPDHLGHGRSAGERALVDDIETLVDDLHTVADRARAEHPGLPVVLVGHSMGGLIAARFAQRYLDELTALVLSGPIVGGNPALGMLLELDPIPEIPIDPAVLSRDPAVGRGVRRRSARVPRTVPQGRRCVPWSRPPTSSPRAARSVTCRRCGSTAPTTSSCRTT